MAVLVGARWVGMIGLVVVTLAGCSSSAHRRSPAQVTVGCSTRVATARPLRSPRVHTVPVSGSPTAAVVTSNGRWAFASLTTRRGEAAVEVLGRRRGRFAKARTVVLDGITSANGMQLTHDGRDLIVAGGAATAVLRVSVLERGRGNPVAGVLTGSGTNQFEVAVSGDDRYVFVSDEVSGTVSVFDLARALRDGFSAPGVAVRTIHLATGALGLAFSPDGAWLYVTTFGNSGPHGLLWVIDAARAEHSGATGVVLGKVSAGCQPVRVQVAPVSGEVWVTALQSNALLAFGADALRAHRSSALQAVIPVGSEPVGLALIDEGRLALVANSNRGLIPGTAGADRNQTVSVIDTQAALAHRPALIGSIPAGRFPRELSTDPATHTVVLANFNSDTIQTFHQPAAP